LNEINKGQESAQSTYHGRFDVVPTRVKQQSLANASDFFSTDDDVFIWLRIKHA
jgi:hypothetical protein